MTRRSGLRPRRSGRGGLLVPPAVAAVLLFNPAVGAADPVGTGRAPAPQIRSVVLEPATVGGVVWHDLDGDGTADVGEPGLPGAVVTLVHPNGSAVVNRSGGLVRPITVGPDGSYEFTDLLPGEHRVQFSRPTGTELQPAPTEDVTGAATGSRGTDAEITLSEGDRLTVDSGFLLSAAVGDRVWNDANGDGVQDLGETGLAGVTITLRGTDGAGHRLELSEVTSSASTYTFHVPPGTYELSFVPQAGWAPGPAGQGPAGFGSVGAFHLLTLTSGEVDVTVDSGFAPASVIETRTDVVPSSPPAVTTTPVAPTSVVPTTLAPGIDAPGTDAPGIDRPGEPGPDSGEPGPAGSSTDAATAPVPAPSPGQAAEAVSTSWTSTAGNPVPEARGAGVPVPAATLARTGMEVVDLLGIALVLGAVGVLLVRRRPGGSRR